MAGVSDVLTVSFDSGLDDESALCVTRKCGEKIVVLKMELGEQADILYHLLTEQMTKAEIKQEKKYAKPQETVTEFADRCKECGARYGKLLKKIKAEEEEHGSTII